MRSIPLALFLAALVHPSIALAQAADRDPWFSERKLIHFGAGAELATNGYTLGCAFWDQTWPRLALGAGLGITANVGKEVYDVANHGEFSLKDIAWGTLGTATGLLISWLVDKYLFAPRRQKTFVAASAPAWTSGSESGVFLRDERVDLLRSPGLQQLLPKFRILEQP